MADDGGLAHGTHGRVFDRRERSDRRTEKLTEGGGRRVGPPQTHGLESPCHVTWVDPRGDLALLMLANSTVANEIHHA